MNQISFIEIKNYIISKLQTHTIDELYLQKHSMFTYDNNTVSLKKYVLLKEIVKKYKIDFKISIKNYIGELNKIYYKFDSVLKETTGIIAFTKFLNIANHNIENLTDFNLLKQIIFNNFKCWTDNNGTEINSYDEFFKLKKEKINNNVKSKETNILKIKQDIDKAYKNLNKLTKKQEIIQSNIDGIKIEQKIIDKTISENNEEIKTIENLKKKEPYKSRISVLKNENKKLTSQLNRKSKKLLTDQTKVNKQIEEEKEKINEKARKIDSLQNEKDNLLNNAKSLFKNNSSNEEKAKQDVTEFFFKSSIITSNIFKTAFGKYYENIDVGTIKQLLVSTFNNNILPSKILLLNIVEGNNNEAKLAKLQYINDDDIYNSLAPLYFSINKALINNELIKTENGITFLNFGNGIFLKILVRKNIKGISYPHIALIRRNQKLTYTCDIFGGYTSSGFILHNGLYIILKKWIVELYFDANATLLQGDYNYMHHQNLSDTKKKDDDYDDEEQRRRDEEYY